MNASRDTSSSTPGWVWLLAGLALGLFVALLVYISGRAPAEQRSTAAASSSTSTPAVTDARAVRKAPAATAATVPPRFDFYTILPEMEVAVPLHEAPGKRTGEALPPNDKLGSYLLQAGSFRSFEEADRLKASLVLLGLEASIQTVTVNNKDTWHRVHIGPYKTLAEIDAVRARLKENRIDTMVLKVKG
ncbi:MAG: SPOR domain-containing protein [Gammaproteobacteria bacterium]|nr:SPOR domain-containing protein [Gammaproteobacteria bacterium]